MLLPYKNFVVKKLTSLGEKIKKKKDKIIELFFINHLSVKEIAESVGTSSAYITKIIKTDERYLGEKQERKEKSKQKRKQDKKNFMKNKREQKRIDDNYSFVQVQHYKATKELSKSRHLTNETYRKWNSSAYKYNPLKKRYEFDKKLGRTADVPKFIKER